MSTSSERPNLDQPDLSSPSATSGPQDAPAYQIPSRTMSAVEHPMIVTDIQKAIRTFGNNFNFQTVLDHESSQLSVPLYLRHDNPLSRPVVSHNAASHNVVLKIVVPKRTGRKRKRGSGETWLEEPGHPASNGAAASGESALENPQLSSQKGLDDPRVLRRKLQDNVGKYTAEAIGLIKNTHRYRGLVDFQYTTVNSPFVNNFAEKIIPGDVSKLRQFSFRPGVAEPPRVDVLPPPVITHMNLPFAYGFAQNPYVRAVDDKIVNVTARHRSAGFFIAHDRYPVPAAPSRPLDMADPQMRAVVKEMAKAFEERPIWTRRSLTNRLFSSVQQFSDNMIKNAIPFLAYQFKGGPWRDAVVRYGLDPRSDPKYRTYQTLMFKTRQKDSDGASRTPAWMSIRKPEATARRGVALRPTPNAPEGSEAAQPPRTDSHVFDGESFTTDGKVWQVCDVTDPLLAGLFKSATVREECEDATSGWYHRGLWAKARAIMKCKMVAITFGRPLSDDDFAVTLAVDDGTPEPTPCANGLILGTSNVRSTNVNVPIPNLGLSEAELTIVRGRTQSRFRTGLSQRKRRPGSVYRTATFPQNGGARGLSIASTSVSSSKPGGTGGNMLPVQRSIEQEIMEDDDEDDEDDDDGDDDDDNEGDEGDYGDEDEDGESGAKPVSGDPIVLPSQARPRVRFAEPDDADDQDDASSVGPEFDEEDEENDLELEEDEEDPEEEAEGDSEDIGKDDDQYRLGDEFSLAYDEDEEGFSSAEEEG